MQTLVYYCCSSRLSTDAIICEDLSDEIEAHTSDANGTHQQTHKHIHMQTNNSYANIITHKQQLLINRTTVTHTGQFFYTYARRNNDTKIQLHRSM